MYNGIGLTSVRGSGTNGYVQRNMAHVSRHRTAQAKSSDKAPDAKWDKRDRPARANTEILDHNRKRAVEVKLLALRESLEDAGTPEEDIEEQVAAMRSSLLAKLPPSGTAGGAGRSGETHADAASKEAENEALKDALGISSEYRGGSAFDRELQAQRKQERMEARAAEEAKRQAAEEELEREREREEKRRRKEARREERREEKRRRKQDD